MSPQNPSSNPDTLFTEGRSPEEDAIAHLTQVLTTPLSGLPVQVVVIPLQWKPSGIGQHISLDSSSVEDSVPGYLCALRLEAMVILTVPAASSEERSRLIPQIASGLMTSRHSLREQGILALQIDPDSLSMQTIPAPPTATTLEQRVMVRVTYEWLKKASSSTGVIKQVIIAPVSIE